MVGNSISSRSSSAGYRENVPKSSQLPPKRSHAKVSWVASLSKGNLQKSPDEQRRLWCNNFEMERGSTELAAESTAKFFVNWNPAASSCVSLCVISSKFSCAIQTDAEVSIPARCNAGTRRAPFKGWADFSRTSLKTMDRWGYCNHEISQVCESKRNCWRHASKVKLFQNRSTRILKGNMHAMSLDWLISSERWFRLCRLQRVTLYPLAHFTPREAMGTKWRLWMQEHCKTPLIRLAFLPMQHVHPSRNNDAWASVLIDELRWFVQLNLSLQSRETFRAIIRSDIGESVPFSTLQNRSQIYQKLTGRKLAKAQLNLQRYAHDAFFCTSSLHCCLLVCDAYLRWVATCPRKTALNKGQTKSCCRTCCSRGIWKEVNMLLWEMKWWKQTWIFIASRYVVVSSYD